MPDSTGSMRRRGRRGGSWKRHAGAMGGASSSCSRTLLVIPTEGAPLKRDEGAPHNGMMAPPDYEMIAPPCNGMIPPG